MKTETWVKPSGAKVPVNANSADHARSLGWMPLEEFESRAETIRSDESADTAKRGPGRPAKPKGE